MDLTAQEAFVTNNPLDLLEELVNANDWAHDRSSDQEMIVQVQGQWADYHLCVIWQPDSCAMYFSCQLDVKVQDTRRAVVLELLAAANERLWLGHFDFTGEEGLLLFRHTIPLRGVSGVSVEQLEDMMDTAVGECERLFPALQLVIWGGQKVEEAMAAAMMDTVGEA
ncbi:type III secretion system chaperone family protein [Algihabitans albus]|uniref:YbjN domain-containing protein n=1 Tax=Algihabitans albus TaxID=2164067 RepID=UPI000E5D9C17|nr:YbjN domain-containing protein [Algihabitans albus]